MDMPTAKRKHTVQLANDLQKILRFQKQRNWEQFHSPKNLAISLALESSEVLELFQWSPDNSLPLNVDKKLADELADVYYYLLLLAHTAKIDLHKAFASKMISNARKYTVEKSRGKSTKYTEL
jgi:dCTP diphosphatase